MPSLPPLNVLWMRTTSLTFPSLAARLDQHEKLSCCVETLTLLVSTTPSSFHLHTTKLCTRNQTCWRSHCSSEHSKTSERAGSKKFKDTRNLARANSKDAEESTPTGREYRVPWTDVRSKQSKSTTSTARRSVRTVKIQDFRGMAFG